MYIVTGGAGLIGSSFIWRLNQAGIDNIIVVDHLGLSEKWKNLRALKFADYFEKDVFLDQVKNGVFDHIEIKGIIHSGMFATTERDASYLVENNLIIPKQCAILLVARDSFLFMRPAATMVTAVRAIWMTNRNWKNCVR